MQVIYGPGLASNIQLTAQKRLLRPVYAQTQGFPYAANIDPFLRTTAGTFLAPLASEAAGSQGNSRAAALPANLTYPASATFTYQGSVVPGTVMIKTTSEYVAPSPGTTGSVVATPFGLLGQWLGGTFDNLGQNNAVGVWMGPDSVYEILYPGFNSGGLVASLQTNATPLPLVCGANGLLTVPGQTINSVATAGTIASPIAGSVVAYLMDYVSNDRILVKLAI